ncbi:MAG: CHAT domain-containing protein [Chloroflexi bacterium]|nr:CHAT domain-containing protein [Chloroflexota bacterium]
MRLLITQTPNTPLTLDAQKRHVFPAQVSFEGYNTYPITVTDPFTPAQEAELEWYYERWLNFPFTDKIRAQHAAASIRAYGHDLFNQLFRADPNLYADYREQRTEPFTIEIIGEPEFHTLHWESLHDPDQDRPLTVDKAIIRRNHKPITTPASVKASPTLNILLVTARPGGKLDVGYRTISRPLVDALENSQLPTRVDIVRPGTFKALVQHLEDSRDRHGDGYYHVIHLDVHGALLTYEQYQKAETDWTAQAVSYKGYGQEPITEYDGLKAFLAFAGEQGGTDLVAADDLAKVLNARQVPIAILNACQSGKQVGAEETSLGSRLLSAGVQLVVAMGYSVTVSAARLLMTHLYQHLLQGDSLETAIRRARLELYHVKTRRAAFSQQIELEDWLLPVVYQHRPVRLNSKVFDWTALAQETATAHQPPHTNYGFVGRDVDILEVERHLLKDEQSNLLLVRGMGGAGKTTLLHHLAWWWQKTRLVQRVFYFGYDVKAYHTQEIVATLALALFGKVDVPWLAVRQKLRAERHLLILDNMESITGERLAVQNTLPPTEQTALRAFLADLVGGKTLILLGSRSDEKWLARGSEQSTVNSEQSTVGSEQSVSQSPLAASQTRPLAHSLTHLPTYDLPGLDPEAQSELAEAILQRLGKSHYRSGEAHREPFRQLLKLLGGYPLAMEVVLNNLQGQTPAQVLDALTQADVALDKDADTGDKTRSILRCIDYSHGNLSPLAQDVLLCLAPFTGVVHTGLLPQYLSQLQTAWAEREKEKPGFSEKPGFLTADTAQWQAVLQEAARWGLVANHEVGGGYLRL